MYPAGSAGRHRPSSTWPKAGETVFRAACSNSIETTRSIRPLLPAGISRFRPLRRQNQFGGALSGPIVGTHPFCYEGLRWCRCHADIFSPDRPCWRFSGPPSAIPWRYGHRFVPLPTTGFRLDGSAQIASGFPEVPCRLIRGAPESGGRRTPDRQLDQVSVGSSSSCGRRSVIRRFVPSTRTSSRSGPACCETLCRVRAFVDDNAEPAARTHVFGSSLNK